MNDAHAHKVSREIIEIAQKFGEAIESKTHGRLEGKEIREEKVKHGRRI